MNARTIIRRSRIGTSTIPAILLALGLALGTSACEDLKQPLAPDGEEQQQGAADNCPRITASRGTAATGGMIIHGRSGSVPGGVGVKVTDKNGKTATTTAEKDGSFTFRESDLPEGFDHTIGGKLTVEAGTSTRNVTIER
jgi:hypothetical protein